MARALPVKASLYSLGSVMGPIKVLPGKGLVPELSVIGHPVSTLIIPLGVEDCGLVSPEIRALVREPVAKTAAISEKRFTHCEMSVMGGRGQSRTWGTSTSMEISEISTNSRSSIR